MSTVNYGDKFYLYGYATVTSGNTNHISEGWIVHGDDYYVMCLSCNSTSSSPYDLTALSILPATSVGPSISSSDTIPSNSDNQFQYPLGSGSSLQGEAVDVASYFYICRSSAIGNSSWASGDNCLSIVNDHGDLLYSPINSDPRVAQFMVGSVSDPSGSNIIYGKTTFKLSLPNNSTNGSTCSNVNNKQSPLSVDTSNSDQSQAKITTQFNKGSCSDYYPVITFVFVPANAYTQSSNSMFSRLDLTTYNHSKVGTPLYAANDNGTLYSCGATAGTCTTGTGSSYIYPTIATCNQYCTYTPTVPPAGAGSGTPPVSKYGCVNNTCSTGPADATTFIYDTATDCANVCTINSPSTKFGCLNNTCSTGIADGSTYIYASMADCTAACNPQKYGCNAGVCSQGSGDTSIYKYATMPDCTAVCAQKYGCVGGACKAGTADTTTYKYATMPDCTAACVKSGWGCVEGTCKSGPADAITYIYPTQDACTAKCSSSNTWIWVTSIILLLLLLLVVAAVIYAMMKKKKAKATAHAKTHKGTSANAGAKLNANAKAKLNANANASANTNASAIQAQNVLTTE